MKEWKTERSVIPVYLIAAVWFVGGFFFRVHRPVGYLVLAVLSVAAFLVGRKIFPDRKLEIEVPDPEPEPEDPEIAALRQERDNAISEMRRLNDLIKDPELTVQIDHIEITTGQIFDHVMQHPEKKNQIRRFLNYYLPTTLKLLNTYNQMDGVSGTNVDRAKAKIRELMGTISVAFDHQLDALFANEALDIDAEIKVLDQVLTTDGLKDQEPGAFGTAQTN